MADIAYWLTEDGRRVEVWAKDCTEADKDKVFVCFGKPRNVPCEARMYLVITQTGRKFFSALGHSSHARFCTYDESSEYGKVNYVDPTGANTSPEDLLDSLSRTKGESAGGGGIRGGGAGGDVRPEPAPEEELRPVLRVPGRPRNLEHLVLTLNSLHVDDIYGGKRVGDFFLDHRSMRDHRKNGIAEGQPVIAICGRTGQGAEYKTDAASIVLVDGFYYQQNASAEKLFFVVNTDRKGASIIYDAAKDERIVVFTKWHRHPEHKSVYISEPVSHRCIKAMKSEHFKV